MRTQYRQLDRDQIHLIRHIDRSESVENIFYLKKGQLIKKHEPINISNEWWQREGVEQKILPRVMEIADDGYVIGAFDKHKIAGIAALDPKFYTDNRLNLDIIFVSRDFRGQGIGRHMFGLIAEEAKKRGASALYVSATPTEHTVNFYLDLGCQLVKNVDPILFEREPEDIHMELPL